MGSNEAMTSNEGCTLRISGGDLILFDANGNVKWRAGVSGATTVVNFDGSILLQDSNNKILWSLRGSPGSILLIRNCELVLVNGETKIWTSTEGYLTTTTSKFKYF